MNIIVNAKQVVGLTVAAVVVIVLLAVAPMIGSTIDDTYTVDDTSTTGWNTSTNTDLDTPAESWTTFVGLIVLAFLAVIIGIVIAAFKDMGEND